MARFVGFWREFYSRLLAQKTKFIPILILAALSLLFLSPAIISGGYFAPADIIRESPVFANGHIAHNRIVGDILYQFLPWWQLSKELIKSGQLPMWNQFSGGGLPLVANIQSAIFFPLTWLFYILNFKYALIIYSFCKLFLIGLFTYLFIKELKVDKAIALIGAMAFMFAGVSIVWLLWPITNVIIFLPLFLFLIQRFFNTLNNKYLLFFSLATALGIFAGHPQTFFYVIFVAILYFFYSLIICEQQFKNKVKYFIFFILCFALGILMSAIVFLPFMEYLKLSQNLADRQLFAKNPYFLPIVLFITNLIPDFFGNPAFKNTSFLNVPNYSEIALGYAGISMVIFSIYALLMKLKDKRVIFFSCLGLFLLCLIYHINPIYDLINSLPLFNLNYNNRLLYVWAFVVCVLGSIGIQNIISYDLNYKKFYYSLSIFGAILIGFFLVNIYLPDRTLSYVRSFEKDFFSWQNIFLGIALINSALIGVVVLKFAKKYLLLCIFILVFMETALHGIIFNTITSKSDFFPNSQVTEYLNNNYRNGYFKTFTYGSVFLPNLSTWYGFNSVFDYDAVDLTSYKVLLGNMTAKNISIKYTFEKPNINFLKFFGVKYLLYPKGKASSFSAEEKKDFVVAYEDNKVVLWEMSALPRAYLISAASLDELDKKLNDLLINPSEDKILTVNQYNLNLNGESSLEYSIDKPGYLVLSENYYPGWFAMVNDGEQIEAENVLGLKIFPVPAGENELKVIYKPASFTTGAILTLVGLILFVSFGIIIWRKKSPNKEILPVKN